MFGVVGMHSAWCGKIDTNGQVDQSQIVASLCHAQVDKKALGEKKKALKEFKQESETIRFPP